MANILVILESPNKIKAVKEILSKIDPKNSYTVKASMGHITNLCKTGVHNLGIDLTTFEEEYELDPGKVTVAKEIKKLASLSDKIYLATDGDTEGTYISWLLCKVLKLPMSKIKRVIFTEITTDGVKNGIKNAGSIDANVVESARMRRELDRLIGFRCSNTVRSASAKAAGRVQSTALKIICDREKEIQKFIPVDYFEIELPFSKSSMPRRTHIAKYRGTDSKKVQSLSSQALADQVVKDCKPGNFVVKVINEKIKSLAPKPPYTTATFQQEALAKFSISSKKCMQIAQALFEGKQIANSTHGLITYMRTDSTRLAPEFVCSAKKHIEKTYGESYYNGVRQTKQQAGAQDAHEAIRVTDVDLTPEKASAYLSPQELKIYSLIYYRTLASLMANAKIRDTDVIIANGKHNFSCTGRIYLFDGYKAVYSEFGEDDDEGVQLSVTVGEKLKDKPLIVQHKKTSPPSRFTESSLVKKMSELGVGRPSTYAPTIELLKNHDYVVLTNKSLVPTELGMKSNEVMEKYFSEYIVPAYTASMEAKMDQVAEGKVNRVEELKEFYAGFDTIVRKANAEIKKNKAPLELLEEKCDKCGAPLVKRKSKYGDFLACSKYPKCKFTKKIDSDTSTDPNAPKKFQNEYTDTKCPKCGKGVLVKRQSRSGNIFYGCSTWAKTKCNCVMNEDEFAKINIPKRSPF